MDSAVSLHSVYCEGTLFANLVYSVCKFRIFCVLFVFTTIYILCAYTSKYVRAFCGHICHTFLAMCILSILTIFCVCATFSQSRSEMRYVTSCCIAMDYHHCFPHHPHYGGQQWEVAIIKILIKLRMVKIWQKNTRRITYLSASKQIKEYKAKHRNIHLGWNHIKITSHHGRLRCTRQITSAHIESHHKSQLQWNHNHNSHCIKGDHIAQGISHLG